MPFSPSRKLRLDKEPIFRDPKYLSLGAKNPELQLLIVSLLHYVDGAGRENANATLLRENLYEFRDDVTPGVVDGWLLDLEEDCWLLLYESGRRLYMQINPEAWATFVSHADGRDSQHPAPDPAAVATQRGVWATSGQPLAEGRGEGGGEWGAWMLDTSREPPQGCKRHPNNTGLIDCGKCAGARRIHTQYMAGEITHARAVEMWGGVPE